jgi:hypothetical protein
LTGLSGVVDQFEMVHARPRRAGENAGLRNDAHQNKSQSDPLPLTASLEQNAKHEFKLPWQTGTRVGRSLVVIVVVEIVGRGDQTKS